MRRSWILGGNKTCAGITSQTSKFDHRTSMNALFDFISTLNNRLSKNKLQPHRKFKMPEEFREDGITYLFCNNT